MRNSYIFYLIFLGGLNMIMCSCKQKQENFLPNNILTFAVGKCPYSIESKEFYRHSIEKYDIRPEVAYPRFGNLKVELKIYNYIYTFKRGNQFVFGELCSRFEPDIFLSISLFTNAEYFLLDESQIMNLNTFETEEYGMMGMCNIRSFNIMADNVAMSPLAIAYLKDFSIRQEGCLVYVRVHHDYFERNKEKIGYNDFVYYGSYLVEDLIENHYNSIIQKW